MSYIGIELEKEKYILMGQFGNFWKHIYAPVYVYNECVRFLNTSKHTNGHQLTG